MAQGVVESAEKNLRWVFGEKYIEMISSGKERGILVADEDRILRDIAFAARHNADLDVFYYDDVDGRFKKAICKGPGNDPENPFTIKVYDSNGMLLIFGNGEPPEFN